MKKKRDCTFCEAKNKGVDQLCSCAVTAQLCSVPLFLHMQKKKHTKKKKKKKKFFHDMAHLVLHLREDSDHLNIYMASVLNEKHRVVVFCTSGKHVRVIFTPLYPTFIQQNWGLQGYTYFSYFCSKT